jgi:hypothetical protein
MEGEKEKGFEGVREALSRYLDGCHVSYEQACSQAVLFVIVSLIERRGRIGAHEAARMLECIRHQVPVLKATMLKKGG